MGEYRCKICGHIETWKVHEAARLGILAHIFQDHPEESETNRTDLALSALFLMEYYEGPGVFDRIYTCEVPGCHFTSSSKSPLGAVLSASRHGFKAHPDGIDHLVVALKAKVAHDRSLESA